MGAKYRAKKYLAEEIAGEIPPSEKIPLDSEPATDATTIRHEDTPLDEATDEATLRLRRQIEALKQAEEYQRQATTTPQRPPSREEKLAQWRRAGLSEADERLFAENPAMIDYDRLTALAAKEAANHHPRGSDDHREATRQIFNEQMARLQAQATPAPAQPSPDFFRPPPPPPAPEPSREASYVSAPVSRGDVGGYQRDPSPSSVRLTPEQKQIAAASGISEVDYAKNLILMRKQIANGERQQ
jgi:hypothetical protein